MLDYDEEEETEFNAKLNGFNWVWILAVVVLVLALVVTRDAEADEIDDFLKQPMQAEQVKEQQTHEQKASAVAARFSHSNAKPADDYKTYFFIGRRSVWLKIKVWF